MLFGCGDLASLILIFVLNACMNMFGLLMENMNSPAVRRSPAISWLPFVCGCWAGIAPWGVVMMYFVGSGNFQKIPVFVYGLLGTYFVFFNTFPINMLLQYTRTGKWEDYR